MYFLAVCLFLPIINAVVIVQIHRNSFYDPYSFCSFIRNTLLPNDPSTQSCVWECVYEHDCQTAVYFYDNNTCSMFAELCTTGNIKPYGNNRASVICYQKDHQPIITCSTTSTMSQRHEQETSTADVLTSTAQMTTTAYMTTAPTTPDPLIGLTREGDTIIGIYNTTAGQSVSVYNGLYSSVENPGCAIDNNTATKYYSNANNDGAGVGFIVLPSVSNATVACGILFATAFDRPARDPITVTLEGSNTSSNATLYLGTSWTLIYNGSTGIDPFLVPNRSTYVVQQNFSNTQVFSSYRLLVTSVRQIADGVQYSEARILGYF